MAGATPCDPGTWKTRARALHSPRQPVFTRPGCLHEGCQKIPPSFSKSWSKLARHHRRADVRGRSEEHTSALQSLMRNSYAVFRLTQTIHTYEQKKTIHIMHS